MDSLPDELLLHILSHLDRGPPSDAHFFDEPDTRTSSSFRDQPLKALSCVSQRWRRIVKPLLFDHLVLRLWVYDEPANRWLPAFAPELARFRCFLARSNLRHTVKSFVLSVGGDMCDAPSSSSHPPFNWFWTAVFECIEPACIKIVALSRSLAHFAGCTGNWEHDWAFKQSDHILELRQNLNATYERPSDGCLMARRRWCHIGYNEGSSLSVYNVYGYQDYSSPSLLRHLLDEYVGNWDTTGATSLTYVAIFPTSDNFQSLVHALATIPDKCNMVFQLAPEPSSTILHEPHRMKRAQPADLWEELDRDYELLAECILRNRLCTPVKSRDYRWKALVETLDDDRHLGALKRHHWAKIGDSEWSPSASPAGN